MSDILESSVFTSPPAFVETKAYAKLQKLSERPPSMKEKGFLVEKRLQKMKSEGACISLLYAFQRINDGIQKELFHLAKERKVIEQMHAMQNGAMTNFIRGHESECRQVLHTASRDLSVVCVKEEHDKLQKFLKKHTHFSHMLFVGIGGSELGPKALYHALRFYHKKDRSVSFISNVDPDNLAEAIEGIDLAKTLVVIVSKSGSTQETATNEAFLRKVYERKKIHSKNHFVSITQPGSLLDNEENYLERFYIWDFIGGRFSSTSMVGGLLLSFTVGYKNYVKLLEGAREMDQVALEKKIDKNLPLLLALIGVWNHNFLGYPTLGIIPYSSLLHRFPAHLQQCDMESNGKHIDRFGKRVLEKTGPILWGEPGTNAQHSFYQLLHQGTEIVPLELIGIRKPQCKKDFAYQGTTSQEKLLSNLFAGALALSVGKEDPNPNKCFEGERPSVLLLLDQLTPHSLGALLSLYEHKIAFQGFLWGINSFDQEGVQLGKSLANEILEIFQTGKGKPFLKSLIADV